MAVQLGTWILVAYLAAPARSSADPHAEVAEMGGRRGGQDAEQCSAITNPLSGVVEQSDLEERGVIVRLCGFEAGETVHCYFRSNNVVQEYRAFTWPDEEDHVLTFRAPNKDFGDFQNTPHLNLSILAVGEASHHSVALAVAVDAPRWLYSTWAGDMVDCPPCLFTTEWVFRNTPQWEALLLPWAAARAARSLAEEARNLSGGDPRGLHVLEVGSWEGLSALWWARKLTPRSLTCLDLWEGGHEVTWSWSEAPGMNSLEGRFDHNIAAAQLPASLSLQKMKVPPPT